MFYNVGMNYALSAQRLAALCRSAAQLVAIEVVAETGSTNADLLARLDSLAAPTLLVAEEQTAGRGRAGRSWQSEASAGLTFSLAWKFDRPLAGLAGLPLAVGVALAEALALFQVPVQLKWPNDILKDGNKLAGILIETASVKHASGGTWAVIGIGINLSISDTLAARIGHPAAQISGSRLARNRLMAVLLNGLADTLLRFDQTGFSDFAGRWNKLHAYAGQRVAILDQGLVVHEGIAVSVDDSGRLLLDCGDGRIAVMAGDVSLRPLCQV
jgi:BirA family transcriptional regulator, biotin operon repressor / biotin---[acetyl-CoA-carboxylase] ligase